MRSASAVLVGAVSLAALTACGSASEDPSTLTVHAAASLTEVFAELEVEFENQHPGVEVVMLHGGSTELAAAIREGAPADVFASADEHQMAQVAQETAHAPAIFATNTMTIVVESGNPLGLTGLADLGRHEVVSVVCAPRVPCGDATARLATQAGVVLTPASEEKSVTDVLGKVASGQADAGVVYVTDVATSKAVEGVPIAGAEGVINRYPIAVMTTGSEAELGQNFVDLVLGATGREALDAAGFGLP